MRRGGRGSRVGIDGGWSRIGAADAYRSRTHLAQYAQPTDTRREHLAELQAYEPAYLAGYKAQRYQVDLAEGFELAKALAAGAIQEDVRRDIGGDEQRIDQVSTQYTAITFKHLLLPVYVGAYRFNGKVFQVVVNGRTGETLGERPYSVWKILFFVLLLLAVIAVLALVFGGRG